MNTATQQPENSPLLPRERELLKTIGKLVRKDPEKSYRHEDIVKVSGLPLATAHRTLMSLVKKGRLEIEKVSGMRLTIKEPV